MRRLMLGNEAVARGLYEAGCRVISSYPGTPSTEITECSATYPDMYAEWAPNEKVATEVALGASIGGARSFCAMKHVGLNVAADPVFTASYTGVNGGMVLAVADDQGMHSSQNEQDSRHYAEAAKLPMVEPSDSQECKDFVKAAYEISEKFDAPVILRLSTRVSHSQSLVEELPRQDVSLKDYVKNPGKYVMMPGNAKKRHVVVEERQRLLREYAETCPLNTVEYNDTKLGIITSGIAYEYAKDALPDASFFKLGLIYPMPVKALQEFASKVDRVLVIEELDDIIETHCLKHGIKVEGKSLFTNIGEYSQKMIREKILGETTELYQFPETIPVRPPVMCPGCPHRGLFYVLKKLGVMVSGDIGCYTLGATPPLNAMDSTICMGASISALHGFNKARGDASAAKSVAVIGDSTFMHSGVTGLINVVYNEGISTIVIVDNSITGMTGHQDNPTTGRTLKGDIVEKVSIEKVCAAVGINRIRIADPYEPKELEKVLREELAVAEPSVVISRRPCALLKYVKPKPPVHINTDKCRKCKACFKIGCPAIVMKDGKVTVDTTLCVGCGLCSKMCAFSAIEEA